MSKANQCHRKQQYSVQSNCFLSNQSPRSQCRWLRHKWKTFNGLASAGIKRCFASNLMAVMLVLISIQFGASEKKDDYDLEIYSVASGYAHLPCNITPPIDDGVRLVLWYKDKNPQPVYSFDARFSVIKHWSEDREFQARASFRDSSKPAQLIISNVQMDDKGVYKCRVDFRENPTVITKIKLNIVEEANKPVIMDGDGSAVMGDIGPFRLKDNLILVCLVEGGKPKPEVIWFRDGQVYDRESDPSTYEDVMQNTLVIQSLDRSFHDSHFECKAINNNVTEWPSSSVTTVLELPLLDLTISNLPDPVTADINYEVLCQVIGSQPPPKVVWKLADVILPSEEPRLSLENNLTTSQLYFTPKIKDQGKVLSCEADNGVFPSANKSVALNVYYIPVVHIEIINDIDPSNIREGDEVVLRCNIQAHPWVWRILWYKDGEELVPSNRVSIDEQRLKLSNVTKSLSGQYVCSASNVEGDGFSKPLMITVNYKPICIAPTIQYKNQSQGIDLKCQVDAKPKSATFRWLFNSSENTFEIPSAESIMSFSNYKPTSGDQHGEVMCWASNDLGEQVKPCVFHVVPMGSPHPPTSCQISNHTASTIAVTCIPGFNGGLTQHFLMEVFETTPNNTQVLVASNWTEENTISVWGLVPESNYIVSVKAVNERGESSPVYVGGKTEGYVQYLPNAHQESRMPLLFVIVGILITLMILGAMFTACLTVRKRRLHKLREYSAANSNSYDAALNSLKAKEPVMLEDDRDKEIETEDRETEIPLINQNDLQQRPLETDLDGVDYNIPPDRSVIMPPERKVSFRSYEAPTCGKCGTKKTLRPRSLVIREKKANGDLNDSSQSHHPIVNGQLNKSDKSGGSVKVLNNGLPVERAVVRTFSIDKMRPICPTCNPSGLTPYPTDNPLDEIVHQSSVLLINQPGKNQRKKN